MHDEFHIFETMKWIPGSEDEQAGFPLGHAHFRRMQSSARSLGVPFRPKDLHLALENAVHDKIVPQRVRVAIYESSRIDVEVSDFVANAADTIWRLQLAETRLSRDDSWLRHKTSNRALYDADRAAFCVGDQAVCDELIYLNQDGHVCEGSITNIFVGDGAGPYRTPALDCGLLPGVLRGQMLMEGRAIEAELTVDALRAAPHIFVGNALRGLIPAKLA